LQEDGLFWDAQFNQFSGGEFIDENGGGAGVRLRKPSEKGPKKTR